jgi:Kef-type K+ transport system membrane component KefB
MTDQQVQLFLADLAIIILLARLLGMAARRLGQPPVLGEIIAAAEPDTIVLGPGRPSARRSQPTEQSSS